jgi:hypothetical protein
MFTGCESRVYDDQAKLGSCFLYDLPGNFVEKPVGYFQNPRDLFVTYDPVFSRVRQEYGTFAPQNLQRTLWRLLLAGTI